MDNKSTLATPRWERRKDARPAELVAAALDLFVEKGFAGTRLDDVAARAGVSKGTLYLYFENKEQLFKAVVRENIVRNLDEARAMAAGFTGPSAELLRILTRSWWEKIGRSKASGITKLMIAESGNFPEITRFYIEEVIDPAHALLADAISRGIDRAEFRAVDVDLYSHLLSAPIVMLTLWKHSLDLCGGARLNAADFLAQHIDCVLAGLVGPNATAPVDRRKAVTTARPIGTVPAPRARKNATKRATKGAERQRRR